MPLRLHLQMFRLNNPLSASFLNGIRERQSGECRREYMVKPGSKPGRASGSLAKPSSPDLLRTRSGEYKAFHATNAGGTTWLLSTRSRVRVPPSRLGQCVYRGVAQWIERVTFRQSCRRVFSLRSVSHDECRWNYMTYGVAGSNPVALTSNGKGVAQLAEHIRCFTNLVVM